MSFLRPRGFFGYTLPPKTNGVVTPADFTIVGVMGRGARQFAGIIPIFSQSDLDTVVGQYQSGKQARYSFDPFYRNLGGQPAKVYWKSYQPSGAVQASYSVNDSQTTPSTTLKIASGYNSSATPGISLADKSTDGNNTGFTLTNGARFSTTAASNALISATSLVLSSTADVLVGDELKIVSSGPTTHYTKVSAVDASTNTCTVSALTNAVTAADVVTVMGFQIATYRKNFRGVWNLVNLPENKIYLSMETDSVYYIGNTGAANPFKDHPWMILSDLNDVALGNLRWPADVSTITALASGADGTAPSTAGDWANEPAFFNGYNVRWMCNTDTTLSGVNTAGEAYCKSRLDEPVWMYGLPAKQSRAALVTLGNNYQRSDQVDGVIVASARNVTDPIGSGPNPVVSVNVNLAVIGAWIREFYTKGFHNVPAGEKSPLLGFVDTPDATEDTFTDGGSGVPGTDDVTLLAAAGVNVVRNIPGKGLVVSGFRTPTTTAPTRFGNSLIMGNFIAASVVESLGQYSNTANKYRRLGVYKQLVLNFGNKLFEGSYPFGIDPEGAFGDFVKADGTLSKFEDVFTVQADQFNNPSSGIQNGDANLFVYFYPTPILESMAVGVGRLIP